MEKQFRRRLSRLDLILQNEVETLEHRVMLAGDLSLFDIDGNGQVTRADSELVARYLAGFSEQALVAGLVDTSGTRSTAASIVSHLDSIRADVLDPDGDFAANALNDATLLSRYVEGLRGEALTVGAVNPVGLRGQPADVVGYLQRALNAPPISISDQYNVDEDGTLNVLTVNGVLGNDTDEEGDTLTAELHTPATYGEVLLNRDGSFQYTPKADFFGTDTFSYTADDGKARSLPATVSLVIRPVNDPPASPPLEYVTYDGRTLTVDADKGLLAAATDVDGDPISRRIVALPTFGTLSVRANGSFDYTPQAGFYGTDQFSFGLSDATSSVTQVASVTVIGTNTVPVAKPLAYTMDEDSVLEVDAAAGIFSGGTDIDGDFLVLTDFLRPSVGEWDYRVDGSFRYQPPPDFFGDVQFFYAVADDDGNTSEQVAGTITVRSVYDPPEPQDDLIDLPQGTRLRLSGPNGLLANDVLRDAVDPRLEILQLPTHGTVAFRNEAGETVIEYVPPAGFLGDDVLTYGIRDGDRTYGSATVNISVTPRGVIKYAPETKIVSVYGIEGFEHIQIIESFSELGADASLYVGMWNDAGIIAEFETISGAVNRVVVHAYSGDDVVEAFAGGPVAEFFPPVHIYGGDGDDTISGGYANDLLVGEDGNDTIYGDRGDDQLLGGAGFDSLFGGNGNDTLDGGSDEDALFGQGGNDLLEGGLGDDFLVGDGVDDREFLPEASGDDVLRGGPGNDGLSGDAGLNELDGGLGSDNYFFDPEVNSSISSHVIRDVHFVDPVTSLPDRNTLNFYSYTSPIYFDLNEKVNILNGQLTVTTEDPSIIHELVGGPSDDYLVGHRQLPNVIYGGDGADQLIGGDRIDQLFGEDGNDLLIGGPGDDFLDGGQGEDTAYGGPGANQIINATQPGNPIQVNTSNTITRFGRRFVSVKIRGSDFDDRVEIRNSGTQLRVKVTLDENGQSPNAPLGTTEQIIDFTDAYLDYQFFGGDGNDYYQDFTDFAALGTGGTVYGGPGNDTLIGGSSIDVLIGGAGNDLLIGGPGRDTIYGEEGDDILVGGQDSDTLLGGDDNDTYRFVAGGDFGDLIVEHFNAENPADGGDRDTLDFSNYPGSVQLDMSQPSNAGPVTFSQTAAGVERVIGSAFADWIIGHGGSNHIDGRAGDDTLEGGGGPDTLLGGDGADQIFGARNGVPSLDIFGNWIEGGEGDDLLVGGGGADEIYGGNGHDRIFGMRGNDRIYGNSGNDSLDGNEGDDLLIGGTGSDQIFGGAGRDDIQGGDDGDSLYGGSDNDTISGGEGDDVAEGGEGNDLIFGGNGSDQLFGDAGQDELQGGLGDDFLEGGDGDDNLFGEAGNDTLIGGRGADNLVGGDHNDQLDGGSGADAIWGDNGDDMLVGPDVGDYLDGGLGSNSFVRAADLKALDTAKQHIQDGLRSVTTNFLNRLPNNQRMAVSYAILDSMRADSGFSLFGGSVGTFVDRAQREIEKAAVNVRDTVVQQVAPTIRQLADGVQAEVRDFVNFATNYASEYAGIIATEITSTLGDTVDNLRQFSARLRQATTPQAYGKAVWLLVRDQFVDVGRNVTAAYVHFWKLQATSALDLIRAAVPDAIMQQVMHANLDEYLDVNAQPTDVVNAHLGGGPLYHVNGMNTRHSGSNHFPTGNATQDADRKKEPKFWFEAYEEAEAVSLRLGRTVSLVYNRTDSVTLGDLAQSGVDMNWSPPLPQHNGSTKVLAGILYRHARANEPISLSSYSQGTIIARNALETIKMLGYGDWVRDKVRWLLIGSPLGRSQINFDVHYTSLRNPRDPVAILGNPSVASSKRGVTGIDSGTGINLAQHNMVLNYVRWLTDDIFFETGNGHTPGARPPGVDAHRYSVYRPYINADGARREVVIERSPQPLLFTNNLLASAADTRANGQAEPDTSVVVLNTSRSYVSKSQPVSIGLSYERVPPLNSTGLHVRLHYDSSQLEFVGISNLFSDGQSAWQTLDDVCDDEGCGGLDGDAATDKYLNLLWWNPEGSWPNTTQSPSLVDVHFTTTTAWSGTRLNTTGNVAGSDVFESFGTRISASLVADFNQDGAVNSVDIDMLFAAIRVGSDATLFDLNGDGLVQMTDVDLLVRDILATEYGDVDLDRKVSFADFLRLSANFSKSVMTWSDGDFSGNGSVDFADFLMLSSNFGFDGTRDRF